MSLKLLLDENIPPTAAIELRRVGYDATHVREVGLKGSKDSEVAEFSRRTGRCLVTLDADFADLRYYPLGSHAGIIRLRLRFAPASVVFGVLRLLLPKLVQVPVGKGALVISDGKRYRVRLPGEADQEGV